MASNLMEPHTDLRQKICRQYIQGDCTYGNRCKYIHTDAYYPAFHRLSPLQSPKPLPWPSYTVPFGDPSDAVFREQASNPSIAFPNPDSQFGFSAAPSYKHISWRTTPCRHFVKNKGWCPLGDECNFIHDRQFNATRFRDHRPSPNVLEAILRRGKDGWPANASSKSHCWSFVQGSCEVRRCKYFHPPDVQPYMRYTPCPAWSYCQKAESCPFKHPELAPVSVAPSDTFSHIQPPITFTSPVHLVPLEVNGTTYFPIVPQIPQFLGSTDSWSGHAAPEASPILFNRASYSSPPKIEMREQLSRSIDEPSGFPDDQRMSTEEGEFPYRPPRNQRAGHARRISVAVKPSQGVPGLSEGRSDNVTSATIWAAPTPRYQTLGAWSIE